MNQIIYPRYIFFISLYTIFLFVIGTTYASFLDKSLEKLFDKFIKNKNKKRKLVLMLETIFQAILSVVGSYVIRELLEYLIRDIFKLENYIFGNPDKFAVVILAPVMFFVQTNFKNKILHIWNTELI